MKFKIILIMLLSVFSFTLAKEDIVNDKITINVKGMTCQNCVNKVKSALESLEGVSDAQVSLENGTATIVYNKAQVSNKEIGMAIRQAGFEYQGVTTTGKHKKNCSGSCCSVNKQKL